MAAGIGTPATWSCASPLIVKRPGREDPFPETAVRALGSNRSERIICFTKNPGSIAKGSISIMMPAPRSRNWGFPAKGIYMNSDQPGRLNIVWNHIQSDGIRLWRAIRPLFDTNSSILDFYSPKMPPAFWPELLAIPTTIRRIFFRHNLVAPQADHIHYGFKHGRPNRLNESSPGKRFRSISLPQPLS
jgi:hypothetical protein